MSLAARIADIDLTILKTPEPMFGSVSESSRSVTFHAKLYGTDKDDVAGQVSRLNQRLAQGCDLVLESAGSTFPQALSLGSGVAVVTDHGLYHDSDIAHVQVTAPCAPYAVPANRVYLSEPFGSDWPDETECERDDAQYVYAEAGRYRIDAVSGTSGELVLYGDAIAGELLVVENLYRVDAISSATFTGTLTWLDSAGDPVGTETKEVASLNAVSTTDSWYRLIYRVPDTAVGFSLAYTFADDPDADCTAYLWGVRAGVQAPCVAMNAPWSFAIGAPVWSKDAWPEHEFERYPATDGGGAAWTHANYHQTLTCTDLSEDSYIRTRAAVPVVPGGRYGYRCYRTLTPYTDGTARLKVWWLDESGVALSNTDVATFTELTGGNTAYGEVTAPQGARFAKAGALVDAGSDLAFTVGTISFGQHILEAPAYMDLSQMLGEYPAPLEVWSDVDPESDAHLVTYAVGRQSPAPYIFEAEALTWTGGVAANSTSADDYPGTGDTGNKNTGPGTATATIDVSLLKPGTYELWVRARSNSAIVESSFTCIDNGGSAVSLLTTPTWMSLGQLHLPPKHAIPGTATTVSVTNVVGQVDRYAFVPLTQGGAVTYHPSTPTTDASSVDVLESGAVLIDGASDYTYVVTGGLQATRDDRLIVNAEEAASDEVTHLVTVVPLHTPRYDLWRGE